MTEQLLQTSQRFWKAMEQSDVATMEEIAHKECCFVHIGVTCGLEEEMKCFTDKIFQPTDITLHKQDAKIWGGCGIVVTDCDYGLLLGGKPTTHHFAVTEVYHKAGENWQLVQFSFTALVY